MDLEKKQADQGLHCLSCSLHAIYRLLHGCFDPSPDLSLSRPYQPEPERRALAEIRAVRALADTVYSPGLFGLWLIRSTRAEIRAGIKKMCNNIFIIYLCV